MWVRSARPLAQGDTNISQPGLAWVLLPARSQQNSGPDRPQLITGFTLWVIFSSGPHRERCGPAPETAHTPATVCREGVRLGLFRHCCEPPPAGGAPSSLRACAILSVLFVDGPWQPLEHSVSVWLLLKNSLLSEQVNDLSSSSRQLDFKNRHMNSQRTALGNQMHFMLLNTVNFIQGMDVFILLLPFFSSLLQI